VETRTVLFEVAGRLCARDPGHPLRVGIDGVCGAGKTTFADRFGLRRKARRGATVVDRISVMDNFVIGLV
jgi:putative protein kinase ArgK-like GTPase of G3E family